MKLIILNRDGVINHRLSGGITTVDEWQAIPGSLQAMGRLVQAGFKLVIATNQPGIASGVLDLETLHAIHSKMESELEQYGGYIDAVFFCPHGPDDGCSCRKPEAGLFQDIAARYQRDLTGVYAIGDTLEDVMAAESAGASPLLVKTGAGKQTLRDNENMQKNISVYKNLSAVVDVILVE
ncbi:MAG: D-glycero-beta-D-manno-heptose 1,7-bisphosphate 7-phosphatase [Gammaproteobacteria bacterium]|nr:D-glycero-beta-D-manno-heptose 1,7-bisphosphate 7-phosphatase [Gammaproteobacteria bacterium]